MPDTDMAQRRGLSATPALQALLIQIASFVLVFGGAAILGRLPETGPATVLAALLEGAIAAALSRWRRMAPWWPPIQFIFPLMVIVVQALHLPSWFFLAGFLLLLALFWTTFRTQVPFYPSTLSVWNGVAARLPFSARFIDIGSGFGGLVLHLAASHSQGSVCGIEVAPLPWLTSWLRARLGRSDAHFIRGDYNRLDLSNYDVVFAFLSPAAMPALWRKACTEMRSGTLLLSYQFPVPGAAPDFVDHPVAGGPALLGWYIESAPRHPSRA
jgi:hypothetical protein